MNVPNTVVGGPKPEKAFPVSWDQFHRDSRALAWRLKEESLKMIKPWEMMVCVTRGGLVPTLVIARELEMRLIETVCVSSYDYKKQGALELIKPVSRELIGLQVAKGIPILIIDDLVDSGATARFVRDHIGRDVECFYATIYAKPQGQPFVDMFVTEVSQDTWIYFPWDMGLAFQPPLVEQPTAESRTEVR